MSRCHFVVEGDAGNGFRLRDTNSRNGTWLNGNQVATAPLKTGDRVVAGASRFAVTLPDEAAQSFAPTSPAPTSTDQRLDRVPPTVPLARAPFPSGRGVEGSALELSPAENPGSRSEDVWKLHGFSFRPTDVASFNTTTDAPGIPTGDRGSSWSSRNATPRAAGGGDKFDELTLPLEDPAPLFVEGLEEFDLYPLATTGESRAFTVGRKGRGTSELCERLGRYYRLVFIINREQLDPDSINLLNYHVDRNEIEPLSKTLFRVDGDSPAGLGIRLFQRASRRDGAICLGFRYTDRELNTTLRDLAHLLCFPSLLARHLNDGSALQVGAGRLQVASEFASVPFFSRVVFAMFEPRRNGGLSFHAEQGFRLSGTLVA